VKYPIEDTLLKFSPDDPIFKKRPQLIRDFRVPMESVGYLLSVWDFCSSFGRFLHLSPFSLTDFENAICHRDGNVVLIVEVHAAILYLLMRDEGDYFRNSPNKRRKPKVTILLLFVHLVLKFLVLSKPSNIVEYICFKLSFNIG
jgi:DDT domain